MTVTIEAPATPAQLCESLGLNGKTAVITGAAGAIAQAAIGLLLAGGANVVASDLRRGDDAERDPRIAWHDADVCAPDDTEALMRFAAERFGAIDYLICAAGVYPECAVADMSPDAWRRVLGINLDGVFHCCRAALPFLRDGGAIVNLTSIAAHRGSFHHAHYAASKGGVLAFSRSLALELAPRVRVNCLSPGPVDTPMIRGLMERAGDRVIASTPMGRIATAHEVAHGILFLCSDWSAFITAETLHLNGGHYIYG
ncbi:SDR family NAD(P)-dependent oxidoreductase [Burkholderia stagnalis]